MAGIRHETLKLSSLKWSGAVFSVLIIVLGASGIIHTSDSIRGIISVAGVAAGVFLGALLTTFLTKSETEKAKALIESAFERVSTKGRGTSLPIILPDHLYVYYVSCAENGRRYWQMRIVELHSAIDIGSWIGRNVYSSPRDEERVYDTEINVLRGRLIITMTAAQSNEDTSIMSVNTHNPNGDRYGVTYHCDWGGKSRLDPAMVFDSPQKFDHKPHKFFKERWPKDPSRIEDDDRIAVMDAHYRSRLPHVATIDSVFRGPNGVLETLS
ncbi:MAG: hypothetical protein F8N15_01235 [Methanobacterium sp.]|nr:hypothetical protein [Methanobacterium sp.]